VVLRETAPNTIKRGFVTTHETYLAKVNLMFFWGAAIEAQLAIWPIVLKARN
jgi:hypothetical protein